MIENAIKNPKTACFQRINKVCSRFLGNKHTHIPNDYSNPTAHAPRVNNQQEGLAHYTTMAHALHPQHPQGVSPYIRVHTHTLFHKHVACD